MNGLFLQLAVSLRLHFRNRMALIYSYLFPTIFLLAFWVLYRYETPPLVRHMGELLTVTALGGIPVEIDKWQIDAVYSGTQKCLSCPPGLAPVSFSDRRLVGASGRCLARGRGCLLGSILIEHREAGGEA